MKSMKRRLAAFLAVLLLMPSQSVMTSKAEQPVETQSVSVEEDAERDVETASPGSADMSESRPVLEETVTATPSSAKKTEKAGVTFNTGNCAFTVVSPEKFEEGLGDAMFEDDGSFTINIPEENPFFPYEVQFTYGGKTMNKWFMTPDDCVSVGGHEFYVSAYFDGTVVTQLSLNVAGDTVVVYPEKKEFTNGDGIMPMSLLPLQEKKDLVVDLAAYTPVELTMVSIDSLFQGTDQLTETDKVAWTTTSSDDYKINMKGDMLDLSRRTAYWEETTYQMIVGDGNQLDADAIRYLITVKTKKTGQWLLPEVYRLDESGTPKPLTVLEDTEYYDSGTRQLYIELGAGRQYNSGHIGSSERVILHVNPTLYSNPTYDSLKAFSGRFTVDTLVNAASEEITESLFAENISAGNGGVDVRASSNRWITLVSYDAAGNVTGCLPIRILLSFVGYRVVINGFYDGTGADRKRVDDRIEYDEYETSEDLLEFETYILKQGSPANGKYYFSMSYMNEEGKSDPSLVTAAYVGEYRSIEEAQKAGAVDIKGDLFKENGGYLADYSEGVHFSIFKAEEGTEGYRKYSASVKTAEWKVDLSNGVTVQFSGVNDNDGYVPCYAVQSDDDSYAEQTYPTIIVGENVDLTKLAPIFWAEEGIKLYAAGSSREEISGESFHDFSKGPVQYTASSEDKSASKNYWLQVIKAESGAGKLYINSLADEDAKTRTENGVVYSTREMFLDGRYDYEHDMLIANMGTEAITNLSVELVSDEVELDEYWRLGGGHELAGYSTVDSAGTYGELPNLAKLRFLPKADADDGRAISGTLTIKSGDKPLIVLNLTGIVGDPGIVTTEIPGAVKYVPYGTMIQNSNKYSWNEVSYSLIEGELPGGMVLKPNGELYGVPTETGEFTFTVLMTNSYISFGESERTFTLTVIENTDANVDAATDIGYGLSMRVKNFVLSESVDQTMVSAGLFAEFVDVFLDGEKLVRGTDYVAESGSTRITIRSQTLKAHNQVGVHTIGAEFRTTDNVLKRAAQNYYITDKGNSGSSNSDSDSGSSGGGSSSGSSITRNAKKGYVSAEKGIITGEGSGYSHWAEDEKGWKLIYADGTTASGHMAAQADGTNAEQILWEKVNGSWYAFGTDGYLKSGWVYDYQLMNWYLLSVENGMQSGWYQDKQDGNTYYMDKAAGNLAIGWKLIDGNWYYFNEITKSPTWILDKSGNWFYNIHSTSRPFGSMFRREKTPDGYYVGENGVWDGKTKN